MIDYGIIKHPMLILAKYCLLVDEADSIIIKHPMLILASKIFTSNLAIFLL